MGQIEIYSGETEQLEKLKNEWVDMLIQPDIPWTFEDLLESGSRISVNDVVRKFKIIPRFQYVVNYLMMYFHCMVKGEEKEELFAYLAKRKNKEDEENPGYEQIWCELLDRIADKFQKNGLPKSMCTREYLQNLILNFNESALYDLALGLRMPFEDVEIFQRRVLKRSGTNFYSEKEFLLYLVLNYGDMQKDTQNEYRCFLALQRDYKKVRQTKSEGVSGYGDRDSNANNDERDDQALEEGEYGSKNRGEIVADTVSIRKKADRILREQRITRLYEDDKMTVLNAQVEEILRWHAGLSCAGRTTQRMFRELLYQVKKRYAKELKGYSKAEKEVKQIEKQKKKSAATGIIQIWYDPAARITLEKDTVFYRIREKKKEDTEENRVRFYTTEQKVLEAQESTFLIIPIKSLTKQHLDGKKRGKLIAPGVEVNLEEDLKSSVESSPESDQKNQSLAGKIRCLKTQKGVQRFQVCEGKDKGKLIAECKFGCNIPKGTKFFVRDGEETYYFESTEEVTAESFAMETIEVVCKKPEGKKINGQFQIADTGSVSYIEKPITAISKISNPKPIKYEEMEQDCEDSSTFTIEVIQDSAEGKNVQKGQRFTMRKKDPRVSQIKAASDFVEEESGEIRGKLTIECETGTDFPEGTEFFCVKDGVEWICRSEKNEINIKDLFFQRFLYDPINRGSNEEIIDRELFGDWFQKTMFDNNVLNRFKGDGNERERNCILTLCFMIYEAEMQSIYEERKDERIYGQFDQSHFEDFEECMDDVLTACRLQPFYMGNPYDCLLAFLSLSTTDAVNILRALWGIAKER